MNSCFTVSISSGLSLQGSLSLSIVTGDQGIFNQAYFVDINDHSVDPDSVSYIKGEPNDIDVFNLRCIGVLMLPYY